MNIQLLLLELWLELSNIEQAIDQGLEVDIEHLSEISSYLKQ